MKAIRIHGPGGPEALKYEDVPDPKPGDGQVLVRVEYAGVNFADIYTRRGAAPEPPTPVGREGAGIVEEVGRSVTEFKKGDKVAFSDTSGAYAELIAVSAERLVKIPEKLSTKQVAACLLQGMTAHYLATSTYPLKDGDVCLVHAAAGGVGELLCQIAKMRGASVLGTVSTEEKARIAHDSGANEVIIYTEKDFVDEVKRLTGGKGVNVVYDSVGKDTYLKSLNCLKSRGMLVLFGQSSGPTEPLDLGLLAKNALYVTRPGLAAYTATRQELLDRANEVFKWVEQGALKVRIFKEFPLKKASEAQRALENRETIGKVLLIP